MSELFKAGSAAVITGAASGIGAAAARRFARQGMRLVLCDVDEARLARLAGELGGEVRIVAGDVSRMGDVERLRDEAFAAFGLVNVLMNNAAIGGSDDESWRGLDTWRRIIEVNLWGVINGVHAFAPKMIAQNSRAAIVNTGSKQGITNPPGHPAYATAKAGVRAVTEQLAHSLREDTGERVSAHLLVPGWTFTGMSRTEDGRKPDGAWTAEQVVDLMVERVASGDFYIICPDNAVTTALDAARLRWSVDDMIENRPALSRWHPAWKERFEAFVKRETGA